MRHARLQKTKTGKKPAARNAQETAERRNKGLQYRHLFQPRPSSLHPTISPSINATNTDFTHSIHRLNTHIKTPSLRKELSCANLRMFPSLPLLQTKWADFSLHSPKAALNPPKLHVKTATPTTIWPLECQGHPCPVPKASTPHTLRGRDGKK